MLTNDAYDSDTVLPNGLIVDGNLTQLNLKLAKNRMSVHNNLFGYKIVNNLHSEYLCSSNIHAKTQVSWQ